MKENWEKTTLDLREYNKEFLGSGKRNSGLNNSLNESIIGWGGIEPLFVKYEKNFKNIE